MPSKKNYSTFLFQVEKPDFASRYTQIVAIVTLALICSNILYNINPGSDFTLQGKIGKIMNILWTYFFLWLLVTIINCSLGKSSGKSTCNKIGYLGMLFLSFLSFLSFIFVTMPPGFWYAIIFHPVFFIYRSLISLSIISLFMLVAIVNIIRYISN